MLPMTQIKKSQRANPRPFGFVLRIVRMVYTLHYQMFEGTDCLVLNQFPHYISYKSFIKLRIYQCKIPHMSRDLGTVTIFRLLGLGR